MDRSWIILLHLFLLGVSSSEYDGAKADLGKNRKTSGYLNNVLKITRQFGCYSTLPSLCSLLCSTKNVQGATLSWYNGSRVCSKITVDDLSPTISLKLHVDHQDKNSYSCVLNSAISNQTQQVVPPQYCEPCPAITNTQLPVKVGHIFTLHTELKHIQNGCQVVWLFGPNKTTIAEILENKETICDLPDKRFRDRLIIDSQTGDLTVTNATKAHSGVYKLHINNETSSCWSFNVSVHDNLPTPYISNHSSHCSSALKCGLECSVTNGSQMNLTWYREQKLLSSIVVSDDKKYICQTVDPKDKNNYSCVVSNSFINETKYAIIGELCSGTLWQKIVLPIALGVLLFLLIVFAVLLCVLIYKRSRQEVTPEPPGNNTVNQNLIAGSSSTNTSQELENISPALCCHQHASL